MNLIPAVTMNEQTAPYVIIGLGMFFLMYFYVRPKLRRKKDPLEKPFATRSLSQQRSVERQMESLLVELSEMSRQMSAQLETRAKKLEVLMKEADEKIERLQTLSEREITAPPRFEIPSPAAARARDTPNEPLLMDPQHVEIYRRIDDGQGIDEIATALNRPNGEIQLILALRPRREATTPGR